MKRLIFLLTTLSVLLLPVWAGATDRFAVWTGGATSGECPVGTPCTLDYAVETVAISGDTVKLNDGTYTIGQLVVPVGVSLVSTVGAGHAVIVQPSASLSTSNPFILLSSVAGTNGNQTISYLEIDGVNGANIARIGIQVKSRDGVTISNCNIHDFNGVFHAAGVDVQSVETPPTPNWWEFWPADPQAPGTDTNINALWPANPVTDFDLNNNTITDCGYVVPTTETSATGSVQLWHLKDSIIHTNTFDNSTSQGLAITGRGAKTALLWNVDVYNNDITMGTIHIGQSTYSIETWVHRGGCEFYNNTANSGFSITVGKETDVYNNYIVFNPAASSQPNIGVEFTSHSHSSIYQNFISGAQSYGIDVGKGSSANKNWITEYTTVKNNIIYNTNSIGIGVLARGTSGNSNTNTVRYIKVLNNVIDGQTAAERGDAWYRTTLGIHLHQVSDGGTGVLQNVDVKNNIIIDVTGYAGWTQGTTSGVVVAYNQFFGNSTNDWLSTTDTNTLTSDPTFTSKGTDYSLQAGSPAIDSGTNPGAAYVDGLIDTVTYNTDFTATPPNIYTDSQLVHGSDPWFERGAFIYWDPIGGDPPPIGGWRKCALVIQETQVPDGTDHTYFPVLFDNSNLPAEMIDSDLECAGGNVDYAFFSDADLTAQIDHEKITTTCHATPGSAVVQIWVEVPLVEDDADTTIYVKYKNQAYGTDYGDYGDVWNGGGRNDYKAVWHLDEASGNALDASQYAEDLTETAGTIASDTGQIGNGRDFEKDETEYFTIANGTDVDISGADQPITIEFWMNPETIGGWATILSKYETGDKQYLVALDSSGAFTKGMIAPDPGDTAVYATGATAPGTAAWQHGVIVYDDTEIIIYRNGAEDTNGADNPKAHTTGIHNADCAFMMGAWDDDTPANYFDGILDEVRISNTARSADWILTTYNSQNSPSTFVTEGAPGDVGAASPTVTGIGIWNNTTSVCDVAPTLAVTAEDIDVYICYELSEQIITVSNPAASEATTDIGTFTWVKQAQDTGDGKWSLVYYRKSVIGDRDLDDQSAEITKNDAVFQDGDTNDLVLAGSAGDIGDVSYAVPYPSTAPKEFSSTSTLATAQIAGFFAIGDDYLGVTDAGGIGAADMSASDGTDGHPITLDGGGFEDNNSKTYGDYWIITRSIS